MSKIAWGAPGSREFEVGIDRGVFYPRGLDTPVPWNGLIKVQEAPDVDSSTEVYFEGIKVLNIPGSEEFAGTIDAFSYPQKLIQYDGFGDVGTVLYIGQQPRKVFDFSYRTLIGNDLVGEAFGYKIHLVYNVLLEPTTREYGSVGSNVEPMTYSWSFSTTPIAITGFKPSGHLILRSNNEAFMAALENILYGTDVTAARMPPPAEVISLLGTYTSD